MLQRKINPKLIIKTEPTAFNLCSIQLDIISEMDNSEMEISEMEISKIDISEMEISEMESPALNFCSIYLDVCRSTSTSTLPLLIKKDKKYSKKRQKILLIWPECMLQEQEEQGLNFDQL